MFTIDKILLLASGACITGVEARSSLLPVECKDILSENMETAKKVAEFFHEDGTDRCIACAIDFVAPRSSGGIHRFFEINTSIPQWQGKPVNIEKIAMVLTWLAGERVPGSEPWYQV